MTAHARSDFDFERSNRRAVTEIMQLILLERMKIDVPLGACQRVSLQKPSIASEKTLREECPPHNGIYTDEPPKWKKGHRKAEQPSRSSSLARCVMRKVCRDSYFHYSASLLYNKMSKRHIVRRGS